MKTNVACLLVGGPDLHITVDGRVYCFEMHPYCGPVILGKRGDPLALQPAKKSLFWVAVDCWVEQGKQIDTVNNCVYKLEVDIPILKHLGGKHF